ncbi:MAG: formimidoylglutamase [Bacteroidales bacterium]|nr:formimidoylglutamase [Bacteroidales bacterium]
MINFEEFLNPISLDDFHLSDQRQQRLGDLVHFYSETGQFPSLENIDLAIIGVEESRAAQNNSGCERAPQEIRKQLYQLFPQQSKIHIADLGNIKQGFELPDTYCALTIVLTNLINDNIVPIIIGGSQDLTFANYMAYEELNQIINIVNVDSRFDIGETPNDDDNHSFLSKIIMHQPNFLFNLTNIGYQTYFVDPQAVSLMKNLFFDAYRLGAVNNNLEEIEPMVRNADIMSIDISAVRMSDAPGCADATPNGFYGEDLCAIARYAGISDKLSSFGIYEVNPDLDHRDQTCFLAAEVIWYFIDGFYNRKGDSFENENQFIKFIVNSECFEDDVIFYKSKRSDRWWMEINCSKEMREKFPRQYLVPCSYKDYDVACKNEVPERWYQVYQKLI